jgi:hypothetical protein
MLTFNDQYTLFQQISKDYSAAGLTAAKRDINEGGLVFMNRLGRKFNKEYKTTHIDEDDQYYQMPGDVLRISEIQCKNGTTWYSPELVGSEEEWNRLNSITTSGNLVTHYFIRGFNEVGLYPVPSTNVTDGLRVSYEPQHLELTQADFTTGSVTVTSGSAIITHSGTGFLPQMVGRQFHVTDGTDGRWYRIAGFTSTSVLTLENNYEGISGSGRAFVIGEAMKIPQGYQDAPVYYALERFYMTEGSPKEAQNYGFRFKDKLKEAKKTFGRSTSKMGVRTHAATANRGRGWIDYTNPVIYP